MRTFGWAVHPPVLKTTNLLIGLTALAVLIEPFPTASRALADDATVQQLIVVTTPSLTGTRGQARWYERQGDSEWRSAGGPVSARLGWAGSIPAAKRRQDSGKTPMGTFTMSSAFGRLADPGARLPYRRIDRDDAWTFDSRFPSTYNVFQDAPRSWQSYGDDVEILWQHGAQYRYAVVIDFNMPAGPIRTGPDGVRRSAAPADTAKGGGIFLHVDDGNATAGCVAIPQAAMRTILQWLDPDQSPRIVIGTPASMRAQYGSQFP